MSPIRSYQDLEVWQMSMDLAEKCYKLTHAFPREEQYGLIAQIRRAADSLAEPLSLIERISKMLRSLIRKLETGTAT